MPNPIADPFVEVPDTNATSSLVSVDATSEGAVTVTLRRPEKKNAFNAELIGALKETFETLRDQEAVRVVFLQGEGGAFSAGADLEWMRDAVERLYGRQPALAGAVAADGGRPTHDLLAGLPDASWKKITGEFFLTAGAL